ncbi:MAG TPA: glutathione S-transferase [Solirubrobacterales bacterium]|nr:glutathione S-transferase [Solirubrobacterales bacterium]
MAATLYVFPGSHPSMAVRLMLQLKGIEYRRVDLMPVVSKAVLKALRFPGVTVPALKIDGRRIQGSREIARELDRMRPEPPLFPGDAERRTAVEEAERWGEDQLQGIARRILWNAIQRDRGSIGSYAEGARLGIPIGLAVKTAAPIIAASVRFNRADDDSVRADLAALPGVLERIDDWIEEGVLGGETVNAADLQVATSLRLLMTLDDVRGAIADRPAGELATRVVPELPGHVEPVFPAAWLEPLRETAPA